MSAPNGLSGGCVGDAVLDGLAELARERRHLLVIDACYQAFHGPLTARLARRGGPVVVVQSMSKSHGLAGARVAVLAGEPALVAALGAAPLENAVSATAIAVLLNALDHDAEFRAIWAETCRTREAAQERLAGWGWAPLRSRANFVTTPLPAGLASGDVVAGLSAAGYRVKDLHGLPGLADCIRFTVGDAGVVDPFLDALAGVAGG
ncbi:aminotransferase class I/II-fold pyridoxal phosphate-dependent enzyme [Actinokineospora soli]|uniref:Aminotransferase n=1 Tax=Actinokineospora soli TaxID=1048753 RepID=A0ABW2TTM6_9PSEU